ncbi:MAG: ferritin family protein [Phycisphaerae bacterium]|nr:ferritin family protein [Phycisphaerae bacterium]
MVDDPTRLAGGLLKAIKAERDGHSFYSMAANASADPKAKEVFAQLAAEESDHMRFLTQHYESVLKTGKPDQAAKLGPRTDLSGLSPIFSDGIKARIKDAHYEMSALSIGLQLEADAMAFYQAEAEAANDPYVRRFYAELAGWEAGHYRALLQQQEELKEEYWSNSGFAPF